MDHPYANLEEQSRQNIARVAMAALNSGSHSSRDLESHESTTYQTSAYRAESGAIVLNRIATTTKFEKPYSDR